MTIARTYTHDGKTMTLTEWGDHLCMSPRTLAGRLKRGFDYKDVFTARSLAATHLVKAFGECLSIAEWSRRYGTNQRTILGRLEKGEAAESAITRKNQMGEVIRATDKRLDSEHVKAARARNKAEREARRAERLEAERSAKKAEVRDRIEREKKEALRFEALNNRREREEAERAKVVAKANGERVKAHASRGTISAESMALIEKAKVNAKTKAEVEFARAMAVKLEEPDTRPTVSTKPHKMSSFDGLAAYKPAFDGVRGFALDEDETGGGVETSDDDALTGGSPSAQHSSQMRFFS
ncbi:hypothetical protein U0C82_01205 [Fulvimarina sp. 2208YS6-2-32]|uniref:Uncharacterized protein n=1 Tax=Fulvimarina uroteuthidis TaxID=3098149 RepID=A0ABU5HYB0_9HYPH|nr:hypothetical protein [Fulvimarina sp. 2208YS6-2-32]MDY8107763.1 hypothetical protein [Fulvimarina sp. 2208YS6-2-32]